MVFYSWNYVNDYDNCFYCVNHDNECVSCDNDENTMFVMMMMILQVLLILITARSIMMTMISTDGVFDDKATVNRNDGCINFNEADGSNTTTRLFHNLQS